MQNIWWIKPLQAWWQDARLSQGWQIVTTARERWLEVDGDQRAAAFGFYLLLSVFPLVIMVVTVGSFFVDREIATREFIRWVEHYIPLSPEQQADTLSTILGLLKSRGQINMAAFLMLIWGALKFLRALIRTTNCIWHSPAYSWWRLPLKSLALLGITASAVTVGILLPALARLVRTWVLSHLAYPRGTFQLIFSIIPWLVLFYGFLMIYKMAPSRRTRFSEVWIGALTVTVLLWLGGQLFLVYAVNFARFNVLYGSLGGIVAFLLWIYLSGCICVFGICLSAAQAEIQSHASTPLKSTLEPRQKTG